VQQAVAQFSTANSWGNFKEFGEATLILAHALASISVSFYDSKFGQ
jgi:hypothetical protein